MFGIRTLGAGSGPLSWHSLQRAGEDAAGADTGSAPAENPRLHRPGGLSRSAIGQRVRLPARQRLPGLRRKERQAASGLECGVDRATLAARLLVPAKSR